MLTLLEDLGKRMRVRQLNAANIGNTSRSLPFEVNSDRHRT